MSKKDKEKDKDKGKYELVVIMKALLPDNLRREFHNKLSKLIEKAGGKIKGKEVWGKKYLAYPIKRHREGYYVLYYLELPSKGVQLVDKELRLSAGLLRHLVRKVD